MPTLRTAAQRLRQDHRDGGKYAKVNPCYRCGKSASLEYWSHLCDEVDALGNHWHDTALCICAKCAAHLEKLDPAAAWAETLSPAWGSLPQGKAAP